MSEFKFSINSPAWVNAVIVTRVPLDVSIDAPFCDKLEAAEQYWERFEIDDPGMIHDISFEDCIEQKESEEGYRRQNQHLMGIIRRLKLEQGVLAKLSMETMEAQEGNHPSSATQCGSLACRVRSGD